MTDGASYPPGCEVLELHVAELKSLFNAMDPAPFRDRDLDPNAEEYIVEWAREARRDAPLGVLVRLDRPPDAPDAVAVLSDAVHEYFRRRALSARRRLRQLLRTGRTSLLISLLFLGLAVAVGDVVAGLFRYEVTSSLIREGFLIGGWVAMWRPLEIFLYDWWPIRAERRLFDRLSVATVRLADARGGRPS
jgi:hypothetical protein